MRSNMGAHALLLNQEGAQLMDLGHPLASVASPVTARVLEVLAGTTRPLAGREVARISGESRASVWRSLEKLAEAGLVMRDDRSVATYYLANRDHLAWPAIESLVRLRSQLVDRIRDEIERWPVQPLHASIFGSFARADAGPHSDIDILLVRPAHLDEDTWDTQVDTLRSLAFTWTGNDLQPFVVDPARLAEHIRANDPLVTSWLADSVHLTGGPLRPLANAVAHEGVEA
jgi:predicted transcriptional regulator